MPKQSRTGAYGQDLVRTGVRTCEDVKQIAAAGARHLGLEVREFVERALARSSEAADLPPVPQSLLQEELSHFNLHVPPELWKQVQRDALDGDMDLQDLVPRLLLAEGVKASQEHLERLLAALAAEADPPIKVSIPAGTLARARAAGALMGVEVQEVLARALAESKEGRLEAGEDSPGERGEYSRLLLDKGLWWELQASAEAEGMEPGELASRVLEPYAIGVLRRHLQTALRPRGEKIQAVKGIIDFGRGGYCPK